VDQRLEVRPRTKGVEIAVYFHALGVAPPGGDRPAQGVDGARGEVFA
jgi:hypothetical protein